MYKYVIENKKGDRKVKKKGRDVADLPQQSKGPDRPCADA
jgi:hypothetical protein